MQIVETVKNFRAAGLCAIPVKGKRPALAWAVFQDRMPTDSDMSQWDEIGADGVGLVAGLVSGGLICLDLDCKNDPTKTMVAEFFALVKEMGGEAALVSCVAQRTPNGGWHLIFRCPEIQDGNQVFAKSDETGKPVIETRGQGGLFVVFHSPGYTVVRGSLEDVKTLSLAEAEILFSAARAIDRAPLPANSEVKPPASLKAAGEITPIDDYNLRATVEDMEAEIEVAGFVRIRQHGENIHFRRPGKTGRDTSATLHAGLKRFFVFSTSTQFEAGRGYSPAALLCHLHNGGNWSDTARGLRHAGFGSPRAKPTAQVPPATPTIHPGQEPAPGKAKEGPGAFVVPVEGLQRKVSDLYRRPFDQGESMGWPAFDRLLRLRRPRLCLVTGIPGSGKSSWTNQAFLSLALHAGWKIAIFSPESASPADHLADLCEIRVGKPFFGPGRMTEAEAAKAAAEISEKIIFIDQNHEGASFDHILQAIASVKPDAVLIDPWNRLMHTRPDGVTETEYIGACLSKAAAFAKALNLSFWIVAHPQKIRRDKDGKQIRPGLYDVSGSAHWANMIDVGIVVWRNYDRGSNEIEVLKIRHKRDGEPGLIEMKFEKETGRFRPWEKSDNLLPNAQANGKRMHAHAALPAGDDDFLGDAV